MFCTHQNPGINTVWWLHVLARIPVHLQNKVQTINATSWFVVLYFPHVFAKSMRNLCQVTFALHSPAIAKAFRMICWLVLLPMFLQKVRRIYANLAFSSYSKGIQNDLLAPTSSNVFAKSTKNLCQVTFALHSPAVAMCPFPQVFLKVR